MNKDDKVVEICENTRLSNGGRINWYDATYQLNDLFECEKSWKAWRSIYRRKKGTHHIINEKLSVAKEQYSKEKIVEEKQTRKLRKTSINADGTYSSEILVNIAETQKKKPFEILDIHGYDPIEVTLIEHKFSVWNSPTKDDKQELYSSSVRVKPTNVGLKLIDLTTTFENILNKYVIHHKEIEYTKNEDENTYMFELGLYDVHFGKFAWNKETNNDYDLNIAEKLYRKALDDLLSQAKEKPINKILLVFGNDFFHFDNMKQETTGGTPQDTDTRLQKMYSKGCDLIAETVVKCMEIAPIEFIYVPSNHDYTMGYFASDMIKRVFKGHKNFVHAHIEPKARKYYKYGKVLLGFTHGDKETKDNQLTVMQDEVPKLWAETRIHEWHKGHFHSEKCETFNSLVMRNFPSITAVDLWHYEKGWIKASRKAIGFLWHENGRKTTLESLVEIEIEE